MTGDIPPQPHLQSGNPDEDSQIGAAEYFSSANLPSTSTSNPNISDVGGGSGGGTHHQTDHGVVGQQQESATASQSNLNNQTTDETTDSAYHLKWIPWNSGMIPIVMQSNNGPCPLIATINVLLLREKIKLPTMLEQITESQLLAYIGESIMDSMPAEAENDENVLLDLEQNVNDAIEILPKLKSGLDVNIRFTGITDFEYTPECIIFDLLRIPLYHGWLSDPGLIELQNAIGQQSYNQLVDSIITNKASQDPVAATRVLIAEEFLEKTASQLTQHGLNELRGRIKDNEIGILFRNNHFLTLFKREGEIHTLVTDHGYLTEDNIVWETLDNIEGAGRFFDANFQLSEMTNRQVTEMNTIDERQQQMVNDYLVALSLKEEEAKQAGSGGGGTSSQRELDDLEVAKRLQAEEDRYYAEMIDKKEQRGSGGARMPGADRQVSIRGGSNLSQQQRQIPAAGQVGHSHLTTATMPGEGGGGAEGGEGASQQSYAQAVEKRSIWEADRRSAAEQADSWNNELVRAGDAAAPQVARADQSGAPSGTSQPVDFYDQQQQQQQQADDNRFTQQPDGRDDFPAPRAPPQSATVAGASQHQQRPSSSGSRRSRSEKGSKDTNCVVQ